MANTNILAIKIKNKRERKCGNIKGRREGGVHRLSTVAGADPIAVVDRTQNAVRIQS